MNTKKIYLIPKTVQSNVCVGHSLLAGSVEKTFSPTWGDHLTPEIVDEEGLWQ